MSPTSSRLDVPWIATSKSPPASRIMTFDRPASVPHTLISKNAIDASRSSAVTNHPRASNGAVTRRRSHREIYHVPLTVAIQLAAYCIVAASGIKERISQRVSVRACQSKRGCKDSRLVATARVSRVQTVVKKLPRIHNRAFAVRHLHRALLPIRAGPIDLGDGNRSGDVRARRVGQIE